MQKMTEVIWLLFIWLTGACIFSFADAAAWRLVRNMDILRDRSRCDFCGRVLSFWEMLPVAGWLLCRGRCAFCGRRVSLRHPAAELAGGFTAWLCAAYLGISAENVLTFLFLSVLAAVTMADLDVMEIPDCFHAVILILTGLSMLFSMLDAAAGQGSSWISAPSLLSRITGGLCVSLPMWLLTMKIPGAFGGGDIKLSAVCGLFLGWRRMTAAVILAVLSAGAWGVFLLAGRRAGRKDHFAFAPFLCGGMFAVIFWGGPLWAWYKGLLLP